MFPALLLCRIRTATPLYESSRGTPCGDAGPARKTMPRKTGNARITREHAMMHLRGFGGIPAARSVMTIPRDPGFWIAGKCARIRRMRRFATALLLTACVLLPTAKAQESSGHLNPVVAKLAAGKTVYGLINTGDLSLANARETARAPVDFVYADMEHSPLDFPGLAIFLAGLTDKAAIVAKKSAQPNVTLFARFPPEADQSNWVVKQALDIGLMGVIFNGVDTKDQALTAVRTMRYPPMRGSARREPVGIRGYSTAAPSFAWGVSAAEYERRADVWPLNPEGDLLAVIMIESVEDRKSTRLNSSH